MTDFVVHGLDPVTRRPYSHTIPSNDQKDIMQKNDVTLGIRFTRQDNGNVLAALASPDPRIPALAIEAADPQTAAGDLVKAYFTLNPFAPTPRPSGGTASPALKPARRQFWTGQNGIRAILRRAIENQGEVRLRYRDSDDVVTHRTVKPTGFNQSYTLLYAYDVGKDAIRSFRLDRIEEAEGAVL